MRPAQAVLVLITLLAIPLAIFAPGRSMPKARIRVRPDGRSCGGVAAPGGALDHDQRNTLNTGFSSNIPWQSYVSANV
jgi:hypothetical protein